MSSLGSISGLATCTRIPSALSRHLLTHSNRLHLLDSILVVPLIPVCWFHSFVSPPLPLGLPAPVSFPFHSSVLNSSFSFRAFHSSRSNFVSVSPGPHLNPDGFPYFVLSPFPSSNDSSSNSSFSSADPHPTTQFRVVINEFQDQFGVHIREYYLPSGSSNLSASEFQPGRYGVRLNSFEFDQMKSQFNQVKQEVHKMMELHQRGYRDVPIAQFLLSQNQGSHYSRRLVVSQRYIDHPHPHTHTHNHHTPLDSGCWAEEDEQHYSCERTRSFIHS